MKIVILGCGRVGATLANIMDQEGHKVSVIDYSSDAFQRLHSDFSGETIVGNGVDEDILIRAGIQSADAFAAVTNGDNRNIMASQIAKDIFNVKKVVCRIYDPIRESTYRELGLETICPTIVGAQMISEALQGKTPVIPSIWATPTAPAGTSGAAGAAGAAIVERRPERKG